MPYKPIDKKLTFVEWYADFAGCSEELVSRLIDDITTHIMHDENCEGDRSLCHLCDLQNMLTEYHKYFKQK